MKITEILKEGTMIYMSTVDESGQPKSRVMNYQFQSGDKICFGTSNVGSAYKELQNNNRAEFSQFARGMYTRISGEVKFVEGEEKILLKAKMAKANPQVVERYTPEGFEQKMEIGYFVNPTMKVMDMKNFVPITDIELS